MTGPAPHIVSGHQPVYLPWLGLFHKISLADVFVIMDDVDYLEQDWNNRNKLKGPQGAFWLTAPTKLKDSPSRTLRDIRLDTSGEGSGRDWQARHWRALQSSYRRAPHWARYAGFFETLYCTSRWEWLAELNETILRFCLDSLGLAVPLVRASEVGFAGRKSALVADHCRKLNGNICVLGTQGRNYVVDEDFRAMGVSLYFQDYNHPVYPQLFGDFVSHLSIVDLLFNCGPDSLSILTAGNVTKESLVTDWNDAQRRQAGSARLESRQRG